MRLFILTIERVDNVNNTQKKKKDIKYSFTFEARVHRPFK